MDEYIQLIVISVLSAGFMSTILTLIVNSLVKYNFHSHTLTSSLLYNRKAIRIEKLYEKMILIDSKLSEFTMKEDPELLNKKLHHLIELFDSLDKETQLSTIYFDETLIKLLNSHNIKIAKLIAEIESLNQNSSEISMEQLIDQQVSYFEYKSTALPEIRKLLKKNLSSTKH